MSVEPSAAHRARIGARAPAGRQRGFTLTELIITLVIGGILVSIAVPSFRTMSKNNRLVTETNSLIGDIQLTRSEAAKRNVPGIVCSSADPMASAPACGGTFATGWVSFADVDASGAFNAGDLVIRRRAAPPSQVTIDMTDAAANKLTFLSTGALSSAAAVTIALCDDRGTVYGRRVDLSATGRPKLTVGNTEAPIASCTP